MSPRAKAAYASCTTCVGAPTTHLPIPAPHGPSPGFDGGPRGGSPLGHLGTVRAVTDPTVPEADAQEQAEAVVPAEAPEAPRTGVEIPEADAQEQAEPVPADEDEVRG